MLKLNLVDFWVGDDVLKVVRFSDDFLEGNDKILNFGNGMKGQLYGIPVLYVGSVTALCSVLLQTFEYKNWVFSDVFLNFFPRRFEYHADVADQMFKSQWFGAFLELSRRTKIIKAGLLRDLRDTIFWDLVKTW